MNVRQISKDVFRFRIWNIVSPKEIGLNGHYTIWWKMDGKWLIGLHGGYGSLTSYPAGDDTPSLPTDAQRTFLQPRIEYAIRYARFWRHSSEGGNIHNEGDWLLPETQVHHDGGQRIYPERMVFKADYLIDGDKAQEMDLRALEMFK